MRHRVADAAQDEQSEPQRPSLQKRIEIPASGKNEPRRAVSVSSRSAYLCSRCPVGSHETRNLSRN